MAQLNNIVLICNVTNDAFEHSAIMSGISKHVFQQKLWSNFAGVYLFKSRSIAREITQDLKNVFNHFLCVEFIPGHVDGELTDDEWNSLLLHVFRQDAKAVGAYHEADDMEEMIADKEKELNGDQ
jgi:hypothetical protein